MAKSLTLFCVLVFTYMFYLRDAGSLQSFTLQACYGNGFEDFMKPNCSVGYKIYVYDVYTYAKRKDRNCPTIADHTNRNITYCCNYVNETEDCGMRYYGTAHTYEHEHYSRCSGHQICEPGVQASWNRTADVCDSTIFMERSNYMKMWYYCLPDSAVVPITNTSLRAPSIYLSSEGYPLEMPSCETTSGSACSVTSSGVSTIRITGFDLQFSERSGQCKQRLHVTDGSTTSDIACDDVNNYAQTDLYTSQSTTINLRLDNTDTSTGGKFWIFLEATDSLEQLTVQCQNSTPEISCNETFTILTPAGNTSVSSNETVNSMTPSPGSSSTTLVLSSYDSTTTSDAATSGTATTDLIITPTTSFHVDTSSTSHDSVTSTSLDSTSSTLLDSTTSTSPDGTTSTSPDGTTSTPLDGTTSTRLDGTTSTPLNGTTNTRLDVTTSTPFDGTTSTSLAGTSGSAQNVNNSSRVRDSNQNPNKDSTDSAVVPIIAVLLVLLLVAAGVVSYVIWRKKKMKSHQVFDETLDPALQSHLPVISSLPPSTSTPKAWEAKHVDKNSKSIKYGKEATVVSLKVD